jgi:hypothetical protein
MVRATSTRRRFSTALVARLSAVSTEHLGEITALPNVAVRHFNRELTKATKPRKS